MSNLVQVRSDHGVVFFDVDEPLSGSERVSRRGENLVVALDERLESALASVRPAAEAVIEAFRALSPDEVAVEFGLRLDAQAGVVVAKTGASGHFTVSLKWARSDEQ